MKSLLKDKFIAFAVHALLSAAVLSAVLGVAVAYWYPGVFFTLSETWFVVVTLVAVDVVLGPSLTFVVFKRGKKTLRFDLAVIAVIQFSALIYGTWVIYNERPAFLVFEVDQFQVISAAEVAKRDASFDARPLADKVFGAPQLVYAKRPTDPTLKTRLLMEALEGRGDLAWHPEYYEPIESHRDEMRARAIPFDGFLKGSKGDFRRRLEALLATAGGDAEQWAVYTVVTRRARFFSLVFDLRDMRPVKAFEVDPMDVPVKR